MLNQERIITLAESLEELEELEELEFQQVSWSQEPLEEVHSPMKLAG
jgi:hypothetical protein